MLKNNKHAISDHDTVNYMSGFLECWLLFINTSRLLLSLSGFMLLLHLVTESFYTNYQLVFDLTVRVKVIVYLATAFFEV